MSEATDLEMALVEVDRLRRERDEAVAIADSFREALQDIVLMDTDDVSMSKRAGDALEGERNRHDD